MTAMEAAVQTTDDTLVAYRYPALQLADRCDQCASGASQAFVRVVKEASELLLCGHHFARNELNLTLAGWYVESDARSTINSKPDAGMPAEAVTPTGKGAYGIDL
jgi:hypothetical protein